MAGSSDADGVADTATDPDSDPDSEGEGTGELDTESWAETLSSSRAVTTPSFAALTRVPWACKGGGIPYGQTIDASHAQGRSRVACQSPDM